MCTQHLNNLLVDYHVICAKVVGSTSSRRFLVYLSIGLFASKITDKMVRKYIYDEN